MPGHPSDSADPRGSIHTAPVEEVYRSLATGLGGLPPDEAERRLYRFGPNAIREVRRAPLVLKFLANFTHLMAVLLWVGGNGAFSFWQEFKAERATEALVPGDLQREPAAVVLNERQARPVRRPGVGGEVGDGQDLIECDGRCSHALLAS